MNRQKIRVESDMVVLAPHRTKMGNISSLTTLLSTTDGELLPPAVVRDRREGNYLVIGGERRWLAAQRLPHLPSLVVVCDVWADYLAWMILDKQREHPQHRSMPMPVTDQVRLTENLQHYLRPGRDDHMDDTLGEYFGNSHGKRIGEARSLKRIMDANNPEDIQKLAQQEWALVATGQASPSAAFQRVRKAQAKRDAPPVDVAKQRSKLVAAGQICTGLVDGLANFGEASPELRADEVAAHIEHLSAARRSLESVIRALRERAS